MVPAVRGRPAVARRAATRTRPASRRPRHLPAAVLDLLPAMVGAGTPPLAALRTALSHLAAVEAHAADLRRRSGDDPRPMRCDCVRRRRCSSPRCTAASSARRPIAPRDDLGSAANYLYMIDGEVPEPARARAIEQYLILAIDHGFNASTFTARVVTSTGADVGAAVVAALGALSGPLHGGAPSRALDTLDAIGTPDEHRGMGARGGRRRRAHHGLRSRGVPHRRSALGDVARHRSFPRRALGSTSRCRWRRPSNASSPS